jgi:rhodanese-related sulfurtransferase
MGMTPNPDFIKVVEKVFPKDAKVVVGCQTGGRSQRAATLMEGAGYGEIVDQRAGFGGARDQFGRIVEPGWMAENLPVESGQPADRAYASLVKRVEG